MGRVYFEIKMKGPDGAVIGEEAAATYALGEAVQIMVNRATEHNYTIEITTAEAPEDPIHADPDADEVKEV